MLLLSGVLSVLITPVVDLSWWKTFRRCVSIASAISFCFVVTRIQGRPLTSYGFDQPEAGKRQLLLGMGIGLALVAIQFGVGFWTGLYQIEVTEDQAKNPAPPEGTTLQLHFAPPDGEPPMLIKGLVWRIDRDGQAIVFINLSGSDFIRLKKLVSPTPTQP
jgi:hypothetical protein